MAASLGIFKDVFDVFDENALFCLSVFGAFSAAYIGFKLLYAFWNGLKAFILAKPLGLCVAAKSLGSWAIVTGSTDGIGKGYAHELAMQGVNIVLISRSAERLHLVASEIESRYHVKTKCVAVDFTGGPEIYDTIREAIKGLDVGVLVNNVGMDAGHEAFFTEATDQVNRAVINCNCYSVTYMCAMLLPFMVEKKKGAIINISSAAAFQPLPLVAIYSATKVYIDFLSRALNVEYRSKGVIIQSVLPYFVATKMSRIHKTNVFIPGPRAYASSALATLGIQSRTVGCLTHYVQNLVAGLFPEWIQMPIVMSVAMRARKQALERKKRHAEKKE